eukprot:TRINITY_DN3063_c0_g5_i1.p1 TRINITY_DN3063_c0_g5~~TRINITY_DN3063_c0_g5_i1.p1  ORF type:complete len:176 (-),score=18.08 TRINITY_DN3063_c0_g5_i1:5-532(-)
MEHDDYLRDYLASPSIHRSHQDDFLDGLDNIYSQSRFSYRLGQYDEQAENKVNGEEEEEEEEDIRPTLSEEDMDSSVSAFSLRQHDAHLYQESSADESAASTGPRHAPHSNSSYSSHLKNTRRKPKHGSFHVSSGIHSSNHSHHHWNRSLSAYPSPSTSSFSTPSSHVLCVDTTA